MARPLSPEMLIALQQPILRPCLLMRGQFKTGEVRMWTGVGPLVWQGLEYTGAGDLIALSPVEETQDIKAIGCQVTLSAVKADAIALSLLEMQRGKPGELWFGLLNDDGNSLVPNPHIMFRGRLNDAQIRDGISGAQLVLGYENELIDLERSREIRYTHEEQQRLSPGDNFLQYVAELADKPLRWGSTT